jgi:flagellum-specific peptidoglycan hydrolase FlgJ
MTLQIQNRTRQGAVGTAAAIVCFSDKPDEPYLLSASQVLAPTQNASVGDSIVTVTGAGSLAAGAVIGTLTDWTGLIDGAGFPNLADAAIARLSVGIDPVSAFPELVQLSFARSRPGAGTALTSLAPSGAHGPVREPSDDCILAWKSTADATVFDYGMADHIVAAFSVSDGDAGAPVLNANGEVVGIVAGAMMPRPSDDGAAAVISPIENITTHSEWRSRSLVAFAERRMSVFNDIPPPATPAAFIAAHKDDALAVKGSFRVPASVCLAQSGIETGWGRSVIGNAFFGVKGTKGTGGSVQFPTHEVIGGARVPTIATFRAYRSFREAADDYGELLSTAERYRPAFEHPDDPVAFGRAIARAGYATSPDYEDLLVTILNSHNLLALDRG